VATTPPQLVHTPLKVKRPFSTFPVTLPIDVDFMHFTHHTWFNSRTRRGGDSASQIFLA
jgi:hypothetical protein